MVNKRTVNVANTNCSAISVGRAAAAGGRCVTMNGWPAGRPGACAIESVSDIYAAGIARCHGGSVTEDRLGTYWGCDGR